VVNIIIIVLYPIDSPLLCIVLLPPSEKAERNMQSLLRWSIENSTTSTTSTGSDAAAASPPPRSRTDLDPGIIDAILGRPDSELMKEALAKAQDASLDEDARVTALDDLEMVKC
jgi:hypothetical protein